MAAVNDYALLQARLAGDTDYIRWAEGGYRPIEGWSPEKNRQMGELHGKYTLGTGGKDQNSLNQMYADLERQFQQKQATQAQQPVKKTVEPPPAAPAPLFDPTSGPRMIGTQVKYDDKGRPIRNDYASFTGKDGNLLEQFRVGDKIGADIKLDPSAVNAIKDRAMSTGPSAWANLAKQKMQLEQQNALNKNDRSAQTAFNQGATNLASRGGASAGQRERLAQQASRQKFMGGQGIRQQGLMGGLNIDLQDDQTKTQLLTQLPGMQMNQANFEQQQRAYRNQAMDLDNQRAMKDIMGLNAYNADGYKEGMAAWGAEKSAQAQASAAGGGGKK